MSMNNVDSMIVLYADDYPSYVWEEYCNICGVSVRATQIRISFDLQNVTSNYDEEDYEDEEDWEDEE